MYKISDFSRLTRLTVKALRYYDDENILVPSFRNEENGYRYYSEKELEKAYLIKLLREFEFSISEIKEILNGYEDDTDLKCFLEEKKYFVNEKILQQKRVIKKMNTYISQMEKKSEVKKMSQKVMVKEIDSILVATLEYTGRYEQMGKYIGQIYAEVKNKACGNPFNLYYDGEYKEEAKIEVCVPICEKFTSNNLNIKELPKIKAVCIMHYGSYETLTSSYKSLIDYIEQNNLKSYTPSREIYLKGPGMMFKGNSDKYETEIIIPIE